MVDIDKVRSDFPQLSTKIRDNVLVYFDNAATTLKPKVVIESTSNHYSSETSNIHRGVHTLSESGTIKYELSRDAVKEYINAEHREEIIFTKGTTDSLNLVATSYGTLLNEGDEILLSTLEHHSNIVPWQLAAEKVGAVIKEIPINDAGEIIQDAYDELLLSGKVKVVAVNHVSNALGTINPIKRMIRKAHVVGAIFIVDGAQAVSHLKVDVQDLDADFYAFSAHKMFGPTGIGVLYGKRDLLNKMPPYQGGGDMIDDVTIAKTTYNDLPHKFEAGTPNIAAGIAFKDAVDYITSVGLEAIAEREEDILDYATSRIKEIEGIKIIGEAKNKCSVLSFTLEGAHPQDIGTLLDQQGIAIRTGHHCTQLIMKRFNLNATARASFSFYNTREEVDTFIEALKKVKELL